MPFEASSAAVANPTSGRRLFTLAEANKALPYVRRIVADIREVYQEAVDLQQRLQEPELPAEQGDEAYDRIMGRLNQLVDELHDVGVELKDYELGLIDFPAIHEGREVYLCWKLGEPEVLAWHEVDAGFAGRQKVDTLDPPA
jgi:hypothetical protein